MVMTPFFAITGEGILGAIEVTPAQVDGSGDEFRANLK